MTTISDFLRASNPLLIKRTVESDDGTIAGYASTFGGEPDSYGDIIQAGAFASSIAQHKRDGTAPAMLWGHDPDRPVGKWVEFREDQRGLFVRGEFRLSTTAGHDAYQHVKGGDLNGLSIGYRVMPGGSKPGPVGVTLLTKLDFLEASIVAFPANRSARVTGVKSFGSRAELESILREHLPARAVKKLLSGGWSAVSSGDEADEPDPQIKELVSAVKAARLDLKGI